MTKQRRKPTTRQSLIDDAAHASGRVEHAAYEAHHAARVAQVMTSDDPKEVERYLLRRWAYKLFARVMNRLLRHV